MNKGDICYSDNGQELEYVAHTSGGHIVLPVYENGDCSFSEPSQYTGEPFVIRNVYTKPPIEKKLKEIAELDSKLAAKKAELNSVSEEIHKFAREEKDRAQRIKRHKQLELLDFWLQDKITHFAMVPEYGEIFVTTKEIALKKSYSYDRDIKLLTLYGSSKGDLTFRISQYSEGSGSSMTCWPFTNEQDATVYAQKIISERLDRALADIKVNVRDYAELIKNAEKLGVGVPEELINNRNSVQGKAKSARIQQLKDELQKLEGVKPC